MGYGKIRAEKGQLRLRSYEKDGMHIIEVEDDGIGFDPYLLEEGGKADTAFHSGKMWEEGRTHIGLKNLRERLSLMCGGALEIKSGQGQGTVARILIPGDKVYDRGA